MSEQVVITAPAGEHEQGQEVQKEFTAITSQADFDTAIQARIARERAKIPADYDELKAKAAEFNKWQESQKTEAQKQADRTAELERENAALKSGKALAEVAATKGIPAELVAGPASNSPEDVAAFADALIAFKGVAPAENGSFVIASEGGMPQLALNGDGMEAALRKALGIA